ncbi:MAG TPA: ATPase [Spirochaetaceae bacterium]|nr:ATPase [Spirochaetaceae bacterium]
MIQDDIVSDLPSVNVGELVGILTDAFASLIRSGEPFASMPSVMLWGQPGVGKSQAVRQVADRVGEETGRKVGIADIRLLLFSPIDLRGIPSADAKKEFAVWLKPEIFKMDEGDDCFNILLLDEITSALPSVQAAAYQLTLERAVGEHKLPDNCVVIAAGNRITDKSVAYKMPKALANRMMHFEVRSDFMAWKSWASSVGIDNRVIGFLSYRRDLLNTFDANDDAISFATPRTWEMVSNILKRCDESSTKGMSASAYSMIGGLVGNKVALEFMAFLEDSANLPDIEDIFDGKATAVPSKVSSLYALCSAMVDKASKCTDDMRRIDNSLAYAEKLPRDFAIMLITDYQALESGFDMKLMKSASFMNLLNRNSAVLNGLKRK